MQSCANNMANGGEVNISNVLEELDKEALVEMLVEVCSSHLMRAVFIALLFLCSFSQCPARYAFVPREQGRMCMCVCLCVCLFDKGRSECV